MSAEPLMDLEEPASSQDFERLRVLLSARTGLVFSERRKQVLMRGLLQAAAEAGCDSLGSYHRLLEKTGTDSTLWDDLIAHITVGETYFFRNRSHFDALRTHVLPELIQRHHRDRSLRIWSAGCSTGEEPYSIAILLRQLLPEIDSWNVSILATDINRSSLSQARAATYRDWSLRDTDPIIRDLYFKRIAEDTYTLDPKPQRMVTFAYLNLVADPSQALSLATNAMDLIICRNVAIYLPEQVISTIAERFHRCLVDGGWLLVGAAEANNQTYHMFDSHQLCGAILYRTPEPAPLAAPRPAPELLSHQRSHTPPAPHPDQPAAPKPSLRARPEPAPVVPVAAHRQTLEHALHLLAQGDRLAAARGFKRLSDDPEHGAAACLHMARLQADSGSSSLALQWAEKAIRRDPLLTEAHYTLAVVLEARGEAEAAIAALKRALYLDPTFTIAHVGISGLYRRQGRDELAERHRRQAARQAAVMDPEALLRGGQGLTAGRLLAMVNHGRVSDGDSKTRNTSRGE